MSGFTGFGRALLLAAAVAVGLAGCGDDSGANTPDSGGSYDYVELGGLKWMKKNLNVSTGDSWCYDNSTANCDKYGRLYTWSAAKSACQSVGWRLPTNAEWEALVTAAGGSSVAGKALKSKTGWTSYSGITNDDTHGFSALPGGLRDTDGGFDGAGGDGFWWSATEGSSDYAYYRNMFYYDDNVFEFYIDKEYGFSARCVKD